MPVLAKTVGSITRGPCTLVHFVPGNLYGGIEKIILDMQMFGESLNEIHQTYILLYSGQFSEELNRTNSEFKVLGAVRRRYPWQVWLAKRRLRKYLSSKKVGLILFHSIWAYSLFASCAKKAGVKVGMWLHDEAKANGYEERICSRTLPDFFLCNSKFTAESSKFVFPQSDCHIAYPVASSFQRVNEASKLKIRELVRGKLGCPNDRKVILIAARFDNYKGHRVLFEALGKISKEKSFDWECWVAGKPRIKSENELRFELEKKAIQEGFSQKIRWLGHQSDLNPYYIGADVYCQPNIGPEPFGMVFFEAQLAKCPVVTTAMGGVLESVEQNQFNYFLEKPCPHMLTSILEKVLLN